MTKKNIELRSEEVQEILSRPPAPLVRWGITAFFVIIVLLFVGGCFFRYPDVVQADIVITTERPPVWMVSRTTGKLKEIFLPDRHQVRQGEIIAAIENPAVTKDVLRLKSILQDFILTDSCVCYATLPEQLTLGNIQSSYNSFVETLIAYRDFLLLDLYRQQEQSTRKELGEYHVYIGHLHQQISFNQEEIKVVETTYNREKLLHTRSVISDADLEAARQSYFSHKQSAEQLKISLSTARIQEAKLQQTLVEIRMQHNKEANSLFASLKSAFDALWVSINSWELMYLFTSPANGVLSYQHVWQENQELEAGEKVFSVIAGQTGNIIGKVSLPSSGIGKVKPDQRVNIQLTEYPYMEFGYLTGRVLSVSLLANENMYTATVALSQELITSYNREVRFTGELSGTAEIMTDERSLTARLFEPIRFLWEKHF